MNEWIDGTITPSLYNTNRDCLLLKINGKFSLGIYFFPDGWWDHIEKREIIKETIQAYMPITMPKKKVSTETIIEWS